MVTARDRDFNAPGGRLALGRLLFGGLELSNLRWGFVRMGLLRSGMGLVSVGFILRLPPVSCTLLLCTLESAAARGANT